MLVGADSLIFCYLLEFQTHLASFHSTLAPKPCSFTCFLALLLADISKFSTIPFTLTVDPPLTISVLSQHPSLAFVHEEWDDLQSFTLLMYSDSENLLFTFITFISNTGISVLPTKGEGETLQRLAKWDQTLGLGMCTSHEYFPKAFSSKAPQGANPK